MTPIMNEATRPSTAVDMNVVDDEDFVVTPEPDDGRDWLWPEIMDSQAVAEYLSHRNGRPVSWRTWDYYVRARLPVHHPAPEHDGVGLNAKGRYVRLWHRSTVDAWNDARPSIAGKAGRR